MRETFYVQGDRLSTSLKLVLSTNPGCPISDAFFASDVGFHKSRWTVSSKRPGVKHSGVYNSAGSRVASPVSRRSTVAREDLPLYANPDGLAKVVADDCGLRLAWALVKIALPSQATHASGPPAYVTTGVFTTAHPTAFAAVKDFLDIHPEHPVQPIAYTHTVHLAKGLQCTFCHVGVDQDPRRAFPA